MRALDEHHISITTHSPGSESLFAILASPCAVIVSSEYAAKLNQKRQTARLLTRPIATGPYFVADSFTQRTVQLRRHLSYRQPKSNIDTIEIVEVPNLVDRYSFLRMRKCHISTCIAPKLLRPLEMSGMHYTGESSVQQGLYLAVGFRGNADRALALKHAIQYAASRNKLNDIHFSGKAQISNSLLTTGPNLILYLPGTLSTLSVFVRACNALA